MFGFGSGDTSGDLLDYRLWRWPSRDWYRFRDLFNGGILVLGRTGSGKTSSVLRHVGTSIVGHPRSGGFILAASPADVGQWRAIFAAAGMSNKLLVFDEHQPYRFNAIDFILQQGGGTRDVAKALGNISEILSNGTGGGGGDRFFVQGENRLLWSAIEVVKQATGEVKPAVLQDFINSAAQSHEQVVSENWEKNSLTARLLAAADAKPKSAIAKLDLELAETYWIKEFPQMASRTRSGILAGVLNTIFTYNTGYVRELIGTTTNISPVAMDKGYFVLVNTPISRMGEEGAFLLGIWKYLSQWYVLRRNPDHDNPPLVGVIDEMQNTVSSMDAAYLAECRKFRGCLIGLSQGTSSFFANMDGDKGKARVNALLTNFTHKILLALGDADSANWAAAQLGNEWKTTTSGGEDGTREQQDLLPGQYNFRANFGESLHPVLDASDFMHGMRTGGKINKYQCDSIVLRSGEAFADGKNWQRVTWSQR